MNPIEQQHGQVNGTGVISVALDFVEVSQFEPIRWWQPGDVGRVGVLQTRRNYSEIKGTLPLTAFPESIPHCAFSFQPLLSKNVILFLFFVCFII